MVNSTPVERTRIFSESPVSLIEKHHFSSQQLLRLWKHKQNANDIYQRVAGLRAHGIRMLTNFIYQSKPCYFRLILPTLLFYCLMISYLLFSIYCSSILSSFSATYSFRDIVHTEFVCHLNISHVGCQKINITIEFVCMKSKFSGRLER